MRATTGIHSRQLIYHPIYKLHVIPVRVFQIRVSLFTHDPCVSYFSLTPPLSFTVRHIWLPPLFPNLSHYHQNYINLLSIYIYTYCINSLIILSPLRRPKRWCRWHECLVCCGRRASQWAAGYMLDIGALTNRGMGY